MSPTPEQSARLARCLGDPDRRPYLGYRSYLAKPHPVYFAGRRWIVATNGSLALLVPGEVEKDPGFDATPLAVRIAALDAVGQVEVSMAALRAFVGEHSPPKAHAACSGNGRLPCPACEGEGGHRGRDCGSCDGEGTVDCRKCESGLVPSKRRDGVIRGHLYDLDLLHRLLEGATDERVTIGGSAALDGLAIHGADWIGVGMPLAMPPKSEPVFGGAP